METFNRGETRTFGFGVGVGVARGLAVAVGFGLGLAAGFAATAAGGLVGVAVGTAFGAVGTGAGSSPQAIITNVKAINNPKKLYKRHFINERSFIILNSLSKLVLKACRKKRQSNVCYPRYIQNSCQVLGSIAVLYYELHS